MTATAPRARRHAGALGVCVGAALGLLLIAFANGGYFPTAWTWGALLALVFVATALVVGNVVRPSRLALVSLGGLTGFGVWTWLALLWSSNPAGTVLEGLRVLFYVAVLAGLIAVLRRAYVPLLLAATLTAIVLASGYGLLTRLFPERLGVFDPVAAYRLEEPLTYWNALGVFAAMGALLALGLAARSETVAARAVPAATLPILLSTLYFTFSRGAWVAGAVGLAVAVAVDPRRLQLLVNAIVLAVPSGIAVLISSHENALTRLDTPLADASHDGHRLAVWILLLTVLSGLAGAGLWLAERRVAPPRAARLAFAGALSVVAVAVVLAVFVRYGGPVQLVRKGYDSFTTTTESAPANASLAARGGATRRSASQRPAPASPDRTVRLAFAGALSVVAVVAVLAVFVRYGGPVQLVRKGYDSFTTTTNQPTPNLNQRLFSFSGSYRTELWHAAWHDYESHPLLGSGPGTYEEYWNQHRPIQHKVRDAHNLYLEVLAEAGPLGLLLLLLALGAPVVAAVSARRRPLVPLTLAALAAFLVHAAVDWDWEMPAVTLTALACAAALLASADDRNALLLSPRVRTAGTVTALLLAVVAFVGVVGASALAASEGDLAKGSYADAASQARKAARWWRWSPQPWQQLGDIANEQGDNAAARGYYLKALSKDDRNWELWYDLATVTSGPESSRALARAVALNRYARSDFEEGNASG